MTVHLVTGATGLLGAALTLEIAERFPHDSLVLLARRLGPVDQTELRQRVLSGLEAAGRLYGHGPVVEGLARRVSVVEADLADPQVRRTVRLTRQVDVVWHAAGTPPGSAVSDVDRSFHLMNLLEQVGPGRVVVVSSLAAAPDGFEEAQAREPVAKDGWAHGKWRVETASCGSYRYNAVVVRPAVLLGDSGTGALHRVPVWADAFCAFDRVVKENGVVNLEVRGDPNAMVHTVHVDEAARQIVSIGMSRSQEKFFHVSPRLPLLASEVAERAGRAAGVVTVAMRDDAERTPAALALENLLRVLGPVGSVSPRGHAFSVTGSRYSVSGFGLERCFRWVMRHHDLRGDRRGVGVS